MAITVTPQLRAPVNTTGVVQRMGMHINPTGIYRGGLVNYSSGPGTATVAPFTAIIASEVTAAELMGPDDLRSQTRIESDAPITVNDVVDGDYIVLRWKAAATAPASAYPNGEPELIRTPSGGLLPYDVIFGKVSGSGVVYDQRNNAAVTHLLCRVEPSLANDSVIHIRGGIAYFDRTLRIVADTSLTLTSHSEIYIYVKDDGTVDSGASIPSTALPLAKVVNITGGSPIPAINIQDLRPFLFCPPDLTAILAGYLRKRSGTVVASKLTQTTSLQTSIGGSRTDTGLSINYTRAESGTLLEVEAEFTTHLTNGGMALWFEIDGDVTQTKYGVKYSWVASGGDGDTDGRQTMRMRHRFDSSLTNSSYTFKLYAALLPYTHGGNLVGDTYGYPTTESSIEVREIVA